MLGQFITHLRNASRQFKNRRLARAAFRRKLIVESLEDRRLLAAVLPGFNGTTLASNDDGSTGPISIGFSSPINFLGPTYSSLYVNNNGNVTFGAADSAYIPFALTTAGQLPRIAPFFSDVDTQGFGSGIVSYGTGSVSGRAAFGVNWPDVGYYPSGVDRLNNFQLVLIERFDTGPGNFDIQFNYDKVQWDSTSSTSPTGAAVGFTDGSGVSGTNYQLVGSLIAGSFLDSGPAATRLIDNSLNSGGVLGRYVFNARAGTVVPNQPPVSQANGPYSVVEGASIALSSSGSTDSDGTIASYQWDFNYDGITFDVDASGASPVFGAGAIDGPATRIIALRVTDDDGASVIDTATLNITNSSPNVNAGADQTVNEGSTVNLSGSFSDPGSADTHTQSWSVVASNGQTISNGSGGSFSFIPNDNGTYTVTYTVTDDDGGTTSDSVVVTVSNVAPSLSNVFVTPSINENGFATLSGTITDAGSLDTFTLSINWGDPLSPNNAQSVNLGPVATSGSGITWNPATRQFSVQHLYLDDNPTVSQMETYTISLILQDDDLGVTSTSSVGGPTMVADFYPGSTDSGPSSMASYNGELYFSAAHPLYGRELFKYNSVTQVISLVADIRPGTNGSSPYGLTVFNGDLYFGADNGSGIAAELWKYSATTNSVSLVADINPGPVNGQPEDFVVFQQKLLFRANGPSGSELWQYNGTSVSLVADINPSGGAFGSSQTFTEYNGSLYFVAYDPTNGTELRRYDGSSVSLVVNLNPGSASAFGSGSTNGSLKVYNGELYFRATNGSNGLELWKHNSITNLTTLVRNINPGSADGFPEFMTVYNGELFFRANNGVTGTELWKYNSTSDTLTQIADIFSGASSSAPNGLTVFNGELYFGATDGIVGTGYPGLELWKYNGTGVSLVADINPGPTGSITGPIGFTIFDGELFFRASNGIEGTELWKLGVQTRSPQITVNNVVPQNVNAGADQTVTEGSTVSLTGSFSDPGSLDTHTKVWSVVSSNGQVIANGSDSSFSFVPNDNGTYTVTYTVTDDDGGTTSDSVVVTVNNVAPQNVNAGSDQTVNEGSTVNLSGTFSDPGTADTHTRSWSVVASNNQTIAGGSGSNFSFVPNDNGTYTITYTVRDDDGGTTSDSVVVTVNNVAPVITGLSVDSAVINENASVTISGSLTDVGTLDTHTVLINWGNGETSSAALVVQGNGSGTFSATHQYKDDNPTATAVDAYTITATVTDDDGGSAASSTTISVNNLAPTPVSLSLSSTIINENGSTILTGVFSDLGTLDTHTVTINWGDGSTSSVVPTPTLPANSGAGLYGISSATESVYKIDPLSGAASFVTQIIGRNLSYSGAAFLNGELYVSGAGPDSLRFGKVDLTTGVYTPVNNMGGDLNWWGLAADPSTGRIYTVDSDAAGTAGQFALKAIEPNGSVTIIAANVLTSNYQGVAGLAHLDSTGVLYGVGQDGFLYTISKTD